MLEIIKIAVKINQDAYHIPMWEVFQGKYSSGGGGNKCKRELIVGYNFFNGEWVRH